MAIIGIGIDVVEIARVVGAIEEHGERFVGRIYTPLEVGYCGVGSGLVSGSRFAGRWAAKEAFYKALPSAAQEFASWQGIQVLHSGGHGGGGRPRVDVCCGRLAEALAVAGVSSILLSITHERAYCAAVVVLE